MFILKPVRKFLSSLVVLCLLVACSKQAPLPMAGIWSRLVEVPKGVQGRCFDETLSIHEGKWELSVIMHSTYLCNQPFLALVYAGEIDQQLAPKNTRKPWVLDIKDIRLIQMKDIVGEEQQQISNAALKSMDEKFVSQSNRTFKQELWLDAAKGILVANLYPGIRDLAIDQYPDPLALLGYSRIVKGTESNMAY